MNLHCKEIELCQTPTYITWLCFFGDYNKHEIDNWENIREKYIAWYQGTRGFYTEEDYELQSHIKNLRAQKKLTFSVI